MQYKAFFHLMMIMSILVMILSCSDVKNFKQEKKQYKTIDEVPEEVWGKVSKLRILFAHQSVGENILDGVAEIMKAYPTIKLNIVETLDTSKYPEGVFAHFRAGENLKPISKMEHFAEVVTNKENKNLDIAFLKLCYVDLDGKANLREIFEKYKATVGQLENQVKLIHFTAPLTTMETSWKTRLKSLLGKKDIWEYADNIVRNDYNKMILQEYQAKNLVDIAEIESTYDNGKREVFNAQGKTYFAMIKGYTYDHGHLNEIGRKKVAEELLLSLAKSVD